jgi:hypothetical protein
MAKDYERPTRVSCALIDLDEQRPFPGQQVLALHIGGCLIKTIWNEREADFYDAWCPYPDTPASVKEKQNERILTAMARDELKRTGAPTLAELTERFSRLTPEQVDILELGVVE